MPRPTPTADKLTSSEERSQGASRRVRGADAARTETLPLSTVLPRGAPAWFEAGLAGCALLLPVLLAIVPRGAAPLVAVAGLCAAGLVAAERARPPAGLRFPAAVLAGLLAWGALSALWAINPWRSLLIDARLAGLFVAALALAAAAGRIAAPRRLMLCFLAGTVVAILLAGVDLATQGAVSGYVSVRTFAAPRLNQIAVWLAIMLLPVAAMLVGRGRACFAILAAIAMGGTVYLLEGTAAKSALALSLPVAALLYLRRRLFARLAAALSVIGILTAPLTLPVLAHNPELFEAVDRFKDSAGHRLLIWSFSGDRIAERPLLGWGLDSARALPGGKDEIRPGQTWLPLHPHNAALQLWLELGAPGAALFALFVGWLWLRIADAPWPRLYAAAAGGSMTAGSAVALAGWGIWQEWWLATLALAAFAIMIMARAGGSAPPQPGEQFF